MVVINHVHLHLLKSRRLEPRPYCLGVGLLVGLWRSDARFGLELADVQIGSDVNRGGFVSLCVVYALVAFGTEHLARDNLAFLRLLLIQTSSTGTPRSERVLRFVRAEYGVLGPLFLQLLSVTSS